MGEPEHTGAGRKLSECPVATKDCRPGGFRSRDQLRSWKSRIEMWEGLVSLEASLLDLEMADLSCVLTRSSLCVRLCPCFFFL
jgi:hypothetical protein